MIIEADEDSRGHELDADLSQFELIDELPELHDGQIVSTPNQLQTSWKDPRAWIGMLSGSKRTDRAAEQVVPILYERLSTEDSIRLFTLQPAVKNHVSEPVCGSLSVVHLGAYPVYDALSYRWGDPHDCVPLCCGDCTLQITRNLDAALRQFRSTYQRPVQLWVDAICIDQSNISERNHQVRNMGQIYKQAERVLVWLGTSLIVPNPAFEGAKRIVTDSEFRNAYMVRWQSDELTESFRELTCQEWFFRTWTSQEIGLAKEATCFHGSNMIDWKVLHAAFELLQYGIGAKVLKTAGYHFDRITFMYRCFTNKSFRDLLVHTRERYCSDPRDKVFALLSHHSAMDSQTGNPIITVNYSHSECLVAAETMAAIIQAERSLDVLAFRMTSSDWPSWVPTLRCLAEENMISSLPQDLNASGTFGLDHVEAQIEGEYSHALVLSGFAVDTINTSTIDSENADGSIGRGYRFTTKTLRLDGAASARCYAGDILLVLCGSKVPFIARLCEMVTRPTKVKLICPCYVHELMHGEIDQMVHRGKTRKERIHIV